MGASTAFEQLAPGIYAVHNRWVEGKSGLLLTNEGTLVIDTAAMSMKGRPSPIFAGSRAARRSA